MNGEHEPTLKLSDAQGASVNNDVTGGQEPDGIPVGTIVGGRYRILARCGQGGMGVVYRVEQIFVGKQLALKTICARNLSDASLRRFQVEARAAFAVQHPNVIAVHDFGTLEDGTPFMAMDYIEGKTLAQMIRENGSLTIPQALSIFVPVCFGLSAAHDLGIVHRDLKPSNIMIVNESRPGQDGSVKILDFGIAKLIQSEAGQIQELTRTGEIFGSPLYMSPEQCQGGRVDHRSDIYSLGCVFFEALAGISPFVGDTALATMMQHLSNDVPGLKESSLGKDFPASLERIVLKMLAKSPDQRYQNLSGVIIDLTRVSGVDSPARDADRAPAAVATRGNSSTAERVNVPLKKVVLLCFVTALASFATGYCSQLLLRAQHKAFANDSMLPSVRMSNESGDEAPRKDQMDEIVDHFAGRSRSRGNAEARQPRSERSPGQSARSGVESHR